MSDSKNLARGILEIADRGFGFLRSEKSYDARPTDAYVSADMIRRRRLREGLLLEGPVGTTKRGGPPLREITSIEGKPPDVYGELVPFEQRTPTHPDQRIHFEYPGGPMTLRVLDLLTPIGKGQRGLVVSPPRTGKTVLLQQIGNAMKVNHPELYVLVLLIDERPEEVTDMRRNVHGEVVASSLDKSVDSHVRTSKLLIARAQRLVEFGTDVMILLDSITRMARAFNTAAGSSGRTLSGGVDSRALETPKRLFGSARCCEEGGSLTILATALIDTGSRMDEVIFEEFKGTGNMELVLDRRLADRRIWPAMDIDKSGTRKEELLIPADQLEKITRIRRQVLPMKPVEKMENLLTALGKFETNEAMFAAL
jgi:transcription termination factor Rho